MQFGGEYDLYCTRTSRLFPTLLKQASVAEQSSRYWGWERSLIIAKTLDARWPQDVPRSPFWRSNGVAREQCDFSGISHRYYYGTFR
jgi:hypothetical protein